MKMRVGRRTPRSCQSRQKKLLPWMALLAAPLLITTACSSSGSSGSSSGNSHSPVTLNIAMAANPQMIAIEKLTSDFQNQYPWITLKYDTLPENNLRPDIVKDVTTHANQYQVIMLSGEENPIWAKNGWLVNLTTNYINNDPGYKVNDLTAMSRAVLAYSGGLYSVPFYSSSSFTMYNKAMFKAAGLTMPLNPTWTQIAQLAAKLNNPAKGVSGICLRGLPGWGEQGAPLGTVINAMGGAWFTNDWKPLITSPAFQKAVSFYVNLLTKYGEPGAAAAGWEQCLPNFSAGKSAIWVDDTVFAESALAGAAQSGVRAGNIGFAYSPSDQLQWTGWGWSWSLGIPTGLPKNVQDAAWDYLRWATGPDAANLIATKVGVSDTPPGARYSTNSIPSWQKFSAPFMSLYTKQADQAAAAYCKPTVQPVPYCGIQYVAIPQFEDIGNYFTQEVSGAITGKISVSAALSATQAYATKLMQQTGYYGNSSLGHGF
jgi:sorbitol/mannitol transport system substrate-binding protein